MKLWVCECVCLIVWNLDESIYSMYNGGLCVISESDYGLGRGVYLYEGYRFVWVVDRLYYGFCKSLCLGGMVCGGVRVVFIEYM